MYEEFFITSEEAFIATVQARYREKILLLSRAQASNRNMLDYLYLPSPLGFGVSYFKSLYKRNESVSYWLNGVSWRMPSLRPTAKFHKDPWKIRPVISKRFSPSIPLGKIIKKAFRRIG